MTDPNRSRPEADRVPSKAERVAGRLLARGFALAGCLAAILGAKLWLISGYGSSTPFWDQWAEATQIYRPYLTGELSLAQLVAPHNEHRIFLTRLVALALFAAEERWDPIGLTFINAAIHVAGIGVLVAMLRRGLDAAGTLLLATFATMLFALPFGWMNTLVGFQTQFYLLVLLAPLSLWLLVPSAAWTPRWWLGTLLGIASYFSIASGALTFPAFIALALVQFAIGRRAGRGEWLGLLVHAVLAAVIIRDIPQVAEHNVPGSASLRQWYEHLTVTAGWPVAKTSWPLIARSLTAVAIGLPGLVVALRLLRQRAPISDPRWLLVALAGWAFLQVLAVVHGRGFASLQSRYYDLLLLGPLVYAAALLQLRSENVAGFRGRMLACIWFIAVVIGVGHQALTVIPADLAWRRETTEAQTKNLTQFLATGDFSWLSNKPEFHVPLPWPDRLRDIVTDPIIRRILPAELLGQPAPEKLRGFILRRGPLLMPIGIASMLVAGLLAGAGRKRRADDDAADETRG